MGGGRLLGTGRMNPSEERALASLTHLCCEGRIISRTRDRIRQSRAAGAPYLQIMQQVEEYYARRVTASIASFQGRVP